MKQVFYAFGLILFGLMMGVGVMRFAWTQKELTELAARPERAADGRLAVYYTSADRAHISREMLAFLQGVQTVSSATLDEDRQTIRITAEALRRGDGQGMAVQMKSPDGFRQIGRALREDFGLIADMAESQSMMEIQIALGNAMTKCVACHGSYKAIEVSE